MPLKVLIAGAGIGGPALAFWLSRIGCTTTVIERSPNLRATGQQVDFFGQGLPVARMMGIENDLRAVAVKEPGMRLIDYKGQSKAYFPASDGISATTDLEVMRGDVVNILYRLTKDLDRRNQGTVGAQADRFMRDLQESPEADDLFDQHLTQIRLPEGAWSKGRIVLLGDAAHCPAPVGRGGGTTSALIGAYLLTGELFKQLKENGHNPKAVDVERAAKEYERILRPSVWEKQNIGTTRISAFFPQSSLGISIIHTMGWLVAKWPFGMPSRGEESSKLLYPDYFGLESAIERDQAHNAIH